MNFGYVAIEAITELFAIWLWSCSMFTTYFTHKKTKCKSDLVWGTWEQEGQAREQYLGPLYEHGTTYISSMLVQQHLMRHMII